MWPPAAAAANALERALDADRVSAFGGIVAINGPVDGATAEHLTSLFLECVVAPVFEPAARELLAAKANLRLLELPRGDCARQPPTAAQRARRGARAGAR